MVSTPSLQQRALECLQSPNPADKLRLTQALTESLAAGELSVAAGHTPLCLDHPGIPERPELVPPSQLSNRAVTTLAGHAALIHAIVHIEFNAINLAWDAVARFADMPAEYYLDWARVAAEEAGHFAMLEQHLATLGYAYGDFPAHDGLWRMALKTRDDVLVRMALVPRVMEARGLDVTPGMIERLRQIDDQEGMRILAIIHRDEIGHVAIGSRWFRYLCELRGLEPEPTFRKLFEQHMGPQRRGRVHRESRRQAGFSEAELDYLES